MNKFGRTLKLEDEFDYPMPDGTSQRVIVLDRWPSKMHSGYFWFDLWTVGPNTISRHVAVVGIDAFTPVFDVVNRNDSMFGISTSRYAPAV